MKNKPLGILIFTFIVVIAIGIFVIKPVVSSILTSWKDYSQAKTNLELIEEKKQVFETLKNNQDNITKVAEIAKQYIPENQDSGQLIIELSATAQANKLIVEQTSIDKTKEETKAAETTPTPKASSTPAETQLKTVDFTMKLSGSFQNFMNFLKSIETSSRLIVINDISMQNKIESDQASTFGVELSGSAYYKDKTNTEPNLENIKLSDDTLNKFLNLKTYGQPIDLPGESGFGRTNPFENY
ncbi:MAG: type 4a pilus biogenesis protein PilO [Patescibacteria group bacterium]